MFTKCPVTTIPVVFHSILLGALSKVALCLKRAPWDFLSVLPKPLNSQQSLQENPSSSSTPVCLSQTKEQKPAFSLDLLSDHYFALLRKFFYYHFLYSSPSSSARPFFLCCYLAGIKLRRVSQ